MYDDVKKQIDERYRGIVEGYEIADQSLLNRVEDLFRKINALGETASNVDEFERLLAGSPIMGEYTSLFAEISSTCPVKEIPQEPDDDSDFFVRQYIEDKKNSFLGSIPIVGSVLRTKDRIEYIKNLGKYDDEDEDDD